MNTYPKTTSCHPFADHRQDLLKIGLIIFIGLLIYSNVLNGPFVFDDEPNIEKNRHIRLNHLTIKGIHDAGVKTSTGMRSLAYISFALDYYFHEYDVAGYHIVNIFIHIVNGILLFYFLKATLYLSAYGKEKAPIRMKDGEIVYPLDHSLEIIAFFATLIWFVNPMQTQSVSYIVQRMNSLSALFYLLAFNLYINSKFRKSKTSKAVFLFLCAVSGLLSFCSKEITATLPFFIVLYEMYFFREFPFEWIKKHRLHIFTGFLLFAGCLYLSLGSSQRHLLLAGYQDYDFTMPQRVMTEFRVVIYYLTQLLFPHPSRLNIDHYFPISFSLLNPVTTLLSMWAVAALSILAIYAIRIHRILSFGILWFLGNLVIESSVIGIDIIFEHRTYLPSIFVFLLFVMFIDRIISSKYIKMAVLGAIVVIFSFWTYERNIFWSNERLLWEDCVKKAPRNKRAQYTLGCVYAEYGLTEKAIEHYLNALQIDPNYAKAHTNLGIALWAQGKKDEALRHYQLAIENDPLQPEVHNNLGTAYFDEGEYLKAIASYQKALHLSPDYFQAHNNLGLAFYAVNEMDKAIEQFILAIQIQPDYEDAHTNLGAALMKKGNVDKAIIILEKALKLNPKSTEARDNLKQCIQFKTGRK